MTSPGLCTLPAAFSCALLRRVPEFPVLPTQHFLPRHAQGLGQKPPRRALLNVLGKGRGSGKPGFESWLQPTSSKQGHPAPGSPSAQGSTRSAGRRKDRVQRGTREPQSLGSCFLQGKSKRHPRGLMEGATQGCFSTRVAPEQVRTAPRGTGHRWLPST